MRNHSLQYTQTLAGIHPITSVFTGANKIFPMAESQVIKPNYLASPEGDWIQFKELNDSTTYLHIKTFDGALYSKIDSVYQIIVPKIKQKPYFIVDIRDNGGGSDRCWKQIAQLIYTHPYKGDVTFAYVTPDIIKRYEEQYAVVKANEKAYGSQMSKFFEERLNLLRKNKPGSFVSIGKKSGKPATVSLNKVEKMPQKAVVIFNRNSASAAEGLILSAMNSKKTITFGENSGGYIAYGNIMGVKTPGGFTLRAATQKTPNRLQYEKTGIPPQIRANQQEDWIHQALKLLRQKSN